MEALRPDVLLSDIEMPGEDGYSLIAKVRALGAERGGNTPAAALTAYARAEDRTRALLAGFQLHVPKPVEPLELVAVVTNLAGRAVPGGQIPGGPGPTGSVARIGVTSESAFGHVPGGQDAVEPLCGAWAAEAAAIVAGLAP